MPTLGRWLGLLALAILVGNLVLELVVLPRDLAQLESARRRLRHWITAVVALLIVTSAGDLIARAGVMTGGDLSQAMAALPLVLTRTHFGAIWISRGGGAGASPGRIVLPNAARSRRGTGLVAGHRVDRQPHRARRGLG